MAVELTNPALADLAFLLGEWDLTLSDASFLPDPDQVVTGRLQVEPIEAGALLAMRQLGEPADPPLACWVVGRDAARPGYTVLYTDGRGVSRVYEMSLRDDTWAIRRDDPAFAQRFDATVSPDRRTIVGRWERRSTGGDWEHDFRVRYTRRGAVPPPG